MRRRVSARPGISMLFFRPARSHLLSLRPLLCSTPPASPTSAGHHHGLGWSGTSHAEGVGPGGWKETAAEACKHASNRSTTVLQGALLAEVTPAVNSFPVVRPDMRLPFDVVHWFQNPVPGNSHNQ